MSRTDIAFRRIEESDLPTLRAWRNSREVSRYMHTDHQISESEHKAWFARIQKDPRIGYWLITWNDTPVGVANLVDIEPEKKDAVWGFYLADPATRGQGIGLYAQYCLLALVFDAWKFDTVRSEVLEINPYVLAMHEGIGFARTGRLPGRAVKDGKPVDAILLTMTRSTWATTARAQLEERIRAKDRQPLPLLSQLEAERS